MAVVVLGYERHRDEERILDAIEAKLCAQERVPTDLRGGERVRHQRCSQRRGNRRRGRGHERPRPSSATLSIERILDVSGTVAGREPV
jgi:hypothetical protein